MSDLTIEQLDMWRILTNNTLLEVRERILYIRLLSSFNKKDKVRAIQKEISKSCWTKDELYRALREFNENEWPDCPAQFRMIS